MTRIRDSACDAILAALDPLPETAPALIPYRPPAGGDRDLLPEILRELELVALGLYPAWLPTAEGSESLTVEQIRALAQEHADSTGQSGQFLADLAEAAVTRRPPPRNAGHQGVQPTLLYVSRFGWRISFRSPFSV